MDNNTLDGFRPLLLRWLSSLIRHLLHLRGTFANDDNSLQRVLGINPICSASECITLMQINDVTITAANQQPWLDFFCRMLSPRTSSLSVSRCFIDLDAINARITNPHHPPKQTTHVQATHVTFKQLPSTSFNHHHFFGAGLKSFAASA